MKEKDINKIDLTCSCNEHILRVICELEDSAVSIVNQYELPEEVPGKMFYVSVFNRGVLKPTLWWRIKTAFKMIFEGTMHEDQVILNEEEAKNLADFIKMRLPDKI